MSTTFKNIVNRFNTTIKAASSINNTDDPVTFNITDATGIPAVPFYFTVEQLTDSSVFERMLATAVDGDEIVATRAQDGSSKQTFAAGDLVQIRVMAAHIDDMTTVINALEDGTALLAGRSGGQTLIGGTASGNDLILQSSSDATKGKIYFGIAQTSYFDETTENLFIWTLNGLSLTSEMTGFTISGGGINSKFLSVVDDSYINQDLQTGASPSFGGLALGVGNLTMTGSIAATANRATKLWATAVEVTSAAGLTIGGTAISSIYAAVDQTMYIGSTQVAINRASATLNLAGIGTLGCGAITATSYDGVLAANLLDKTAAEVVSGFWTFPTGIRIETEDYNYLDMYSYKAGSPTNVIDMYSARGTKGTPTTVAINDDMINIRSKGYDGDSYSECARMMVEVDDEVSDGIVPGRWLFYTTDTSGNVVEALRLDSSQNATFAGTLACGAITSTGNLTISRTSADNILTIDNTGNTNYSTVFFKRESSVGTGKGGAYIRVQSNTATSATSLELGAGSNINADTAYNALVLNSDKSVDLAGTARVAGDPATDGYFVIKLSGVSYKVPCLAV